MARMFAFIGNRAELGPHALKAHRAHLTFHNPEQRARGWGFGFFQSGEVLLRRRPVDTRSVVDFSETVGRLRTDMLLGHVRCATTGDLRTENTHPFRYRSWLAAQTGTVKGFSRLGARLLEQVPEFLQRNIRGETDAECCFYLLLSFLHDAGALTDTRPADPDAVRGALRSMLSLVDGLSAEEGHPANTGDFAVSDGEHLYFVHRPEVGTSAGYRTFTGSRDVEELLAADEGALVAEPLRVPRADSSHLTLIATGLSSVPVGWSTLEEPVLLTAQRDTPPQRDPL